MYNLTFNTPYNQKIVKKLDAFRERQRKMNCIVNDPEPTHSIYREPKGHISVRTGGKFVTAWGKLNRQ